MEEWYSGRRTKTAISGGPYKDGSQIVEDEDDAWAAALTYSRKQRLAYASDREDIFAPPAEDEKKGTVNAMGHSSGRNSHRGLRSCCLLVVYLLFTTNFRNAPPVLRLYFLFIVVLASVV